MGKKLPIILVLLALVGVAVAAAVANPVVITNYHTWFQSQTTLFTAVAIITPWIVKLTTALGKDWFSTSGKTTQWLSLGVSIVIAGIGGWLSLGFLAGSFGWHGALQAVILTAIAFLGSNGLAKAARQEASSGALRAASSGVDAVATAQDQANKAAAAAQKAAAMAQVAADAAKSVKG